jgi:electron transport complex protein RnfA
MDTLNVLLMGFISVVLINNLVFTKFLGICPYLGVSGRIDMAFGMGMAVTFVVTLSGTLSSWLRCICESSSRRCTRASAYFCR